MGGVKGGVCTVCVCVCLEREKQNELSVFALHCGELSIVTGAESGLLLLHLKGGIDLISRKKEERENEEKLM